MSSKDNSNIQDSIIPGVDSYSSCADFLVKHNVNKTNGEIKRQAQILVLEIKLKVLLAEITIYLI